MYLVGLGVGTTAVSAMAKFDGCEHCRKPRREGELLNFVDCWAVGQGRRRPSYYIVCDHCYDARQQWCEDVFPDVCARCGSTIPHAEHYLDKINNRDEKEIRIYGLALDETCSIICEACHRQAKCE